MSYTPALKERLKAVTANINELTKMTPETDQPIKQRLTMVYSQHITDELATMLKINDTTKLLESLKTFLDDNWNVVKGTCLSYTALPKADITQSLREVTNFCHEHNKETSALALLMPGICLEKNDALDSLNLPKHLATLPLTAVLQSHIETHQGKQLQPIASLLACLPSDEAQHSSLYAPYWDTGSDDLNQSSMDAGDLKRLKQHSALTQDYVRLVEQRDSLNAGSSNLYDHLILLLKALKLNSASGLGAETNAAGGAYSPIFEFFEYYNQVDDHTKKQIPADLREEIETLKGLSSDKTKNNNATETIETCLDTRYNQLQPKIAEHEALLKNWGLEMINSSN